MGESGFRDALFLFLLPKCGVSSFSQYEVTCESFVQERPSRATTTTNRTVPGWADGDGQPSIESGKDPKAGISADSRTGSRHSILFISHEASLTGAPFVLLHLQRWIKANTDFKLTTLLRRGGPLLPEFAKLGDTIVLEPSLSGGPRWICGVARRLGLGRVYRWRSFQTLRNRSFQLVYSNTVTNGDLLAEVARPTIPVITHVHELAYWIERSGRENWEAVRRHTTHFVAASEAVSENLVQRYQIPANQVSVVHEFIPVEQFGRSVDSEQRRKIRSTLGIPPDAFVVGGSGMETWRKGKDLFVQLGRVHPSAESGVPLSLRVGWLAG